MTRRFKCTNEKSKFNGLLNIEMPIYFNFYKDSENCYYPIHSSLFELILDGWVEVK